MNIIKENIYWILICVLLPYSLLVFLLLSDGSDLNFLEDFAVIIVLICFFVPAIYSKKLLSYNIKNTRHMKGKSGLFKFLYFFILSGIVISSWVFFIFFVLTFLFN